MENTLIVKLAKPYVFEDKTYNEIDLTGLEDLTASDLIQAEKMFVNSGNIPILSEMTLEYACQICTTATGLPVEFFKRLPAKVASKIKVVVRNFLNAEE